jgi:hypothetical protein
MVKIMGFDVSVDIANIFKEIEKSRKRRDKENLAKDLTRVEVLANYKGDNIAKDLIRTYKKNLKFVEGLDL